MVKIGEFQGAFRFLSNFWPAAVTLDGVEYPSVEHAYQAAKFAKTSQVRVAILGAPTPSAAKRIGRRYPARGGWEDDKLAVMLDLVRQKFRDADLRGRLLGTGDAELIEGNWWGDRFWGVSRGAGENNLGKILMRVRGEIRGRD